MTVSTPMRFTIIENFHFLSVETTNVGCFLNKGHENSFRSDRVDRVAEEAALSLFRARGEEVQANESTSSS